jgi:hypothetical protein
MQDLLSAFMNRQSRKLWRVVVLWAILPGPVVAGADDAEDGAVAEDAPRNREAVVDETAIDQWIFQENPGRKRTQRTANAAAARARIDVQLKALLDELGEVSRLNEAQRQQLALAARGDIKRFFDQVGKVRKKFVAANNDQNQMNQVWQEARSLQQQYAKGLFDDDSLFSKALRKTLTAQQQAGYKAVLLDRRRVGYRVAIEESLVRLGNGVGLRREQRESLQKLLLEETQPPLLFGQLDQQLVLLRLSQLPPEKLREVLDRGQWKQLRPQLLQASGTEDALARYGVIEEPRTTTVILRSVRTVVDAPAEARQAE